MHVLAIEPDAILGHVASWGDRNPLTVNYDATLATVKIEAGGADFLNRKCGKNLQPLV